MIKREPNEVIHDALEKGIIKIITIGVDLESGKKNIDYAKHLKNVYTAMGFHPHESKKMKEEELIQLEEMLSYSKNIAVGEIGDIEFTLVNPVTKEYQCEYCHEKTSL